MPAYKVIEQLDVDDYQAILLSDGLKGLSPLDMMQRIFELAERSLLAPVVGRRRLRHDERAVGRERGDPAPAAPTRDREGIVNPRPAVGRATRGPTHR